MSRVAERNARKPSSVTSGVGRQSRTAEAAVRARGPLSANTGRMQFGAAGADSRSSRNEERHDWLVPMELP